MKTAFVVGATGLIGENVVKQLCEDENYSSVHAVTRRELDFQHHKLRNKVKELQRIDEQDLNGVTDVFCCIGTTMKKAGSKGAFKFVDFDLPFHVARIAKQSGVQKFLVISAMGANEQSPFFYSKTKGQLEKALEKLNFDDLIIFRPALLTGERDEFRLAENLSSVLYKGLNPLLIGSLRKYRSIEGEKVASLFIQAANEKNKEGLTIVTSEQMQQVE